MNRKKSNNSENINNNEGASQMVKCQRTFVSWVVFIWVVAVLTGFMGYAFNEAREAQRMVANNKEYYQIEMAKVQAQLSQIQTDLQWIKSNIK